MKQLLILAVGAAWAGAAFADTGRADSREVVEKVERAAELLRRRPDDALELLRDPQGEFVWKDTYVFVVNCEADRVISNPVFPDRVGGDIKQHTDYAGYRYGIELCATASAPGGGWIEYFWLPPGSDTPVRKLSYVRSVSGTPYQIGAGVYDHGMTEPHRYRELHNEH